MMGAPGMALIVAACLFAGIAMGCVAFDRGSKIAKARRLSDALGTTSQQSRLSATSRAGDWALGYARALTRRLFIGSTDPIAPSVRSRRAGETRAGAKFRQEAKAAGCDKDITVSAYCEACTRLAIATALAGALLGAALSPELAVLLCAAGAFGGRMLLPLALRKEMRRRSNDAELHLSEMLEVVSLGLRSGMTFDRSFALYGAHFESDFAHSCARAHRCWALGFMDRDEALHDLAASYDCAQLSHVIDSILRSLKFGSSLAGILEEASTQSRSAYRTAIEERVAKAPVKMMIPTGTLILPAMLLMVMGPILLELVSGF